MIGSTVAENQPADHPMETSENADRTLASRRETGSRRRSSLARGYRRSIWNRLEPQRQQVGDESATGVDLCVQKEPRARDIYRPFRVGLLSAQPKARRNAEGGKSDEILNQR